MSPVGFHSDDAVTRAVRELQRKLGARVRESSEEMLRQLEEELRSDVPHLVEEITPPPPPNPAAELLAAISRVDSESTQTDILKALVEETRRFASRTAFFLIRVGEVRGWTGEGWSAAAANLAAVRFDMPREGAWADLAQGNGAVRLDADGCRDLAGRIDAEAGSEGILVPFVLRGKLAGTLFADRVGDGAAPDFASLQLLTHAAAQALETVSFRDRGASPALRVSALQEAAGLPLWRPDEAPAPAVTEPAAVAEAVEEAAAVVPEPEPAPAAVEPELAAPEESVEPEHVEPVAEEPWAEEPEDVFATDFAVEPLGEPAGETVDEPAAGDDGRIWEEDDEPTVVGREGAVEGPAPPYFGEAGQQTVRLDTAQLASPPAAAPIAEPQFELEPETEASGFEPEPPSAFAPAPQPPAPAEVTPLEARPPAPTPAAGPSVAPPAVERPPIEPPPPAPPPVEPPPVEPPPVEPPPAVAPPAAVPPARPAEAGSTEVRPPADLDGPGLAFSAKPLTAAAEIGSVPAGEEALHEEARRLARLLVSEIKLYNEEVIEEGRMAGNIYSRLREDIDRSRQMYDERIDPRIQEDYFYQELVQRLAGGDPKLLGM